LGHDKTGPVKKGRVLELVGRDEVEFYGRKNNRQELV